MKKTLFLSISLLALCACSQKHVYTVSDGKRMDTSEKSVVPEENLRRQFPLLTGETGVISMVPNATAFRMSGDYADNVAITLTPEGDILYYPAPTDITADSEPIDLGNGWWLNCQGFGKNSVFTKYTFAEYASLPQAPSIEQLKLAIIPGAKVTEFVELPVKLDRARQNPAEVKELLKNQ